MKKYLSLVMIGLSLMLSGCNKDDNNDPDTPPTGDTGKVRYEATVSDPENFKLLIHYTVGVDISSEAPEEAAKEGKVFDTVLFRVLPGMDDKRTLL